MNKEKIGICESTVFNIIVVDMHKAYLSLT